jgi:pSer/pThr/pTyr-binding forkhead associated (FHA) protein
MVGSDRRDAVPTKKSDAGFPSAVDTVVDLPVPAVAEPEERSLLIEVEVVGGPMDGHRRRVVVGELSIGRGEGNDLKLPLDPKVSTHHARILVEGRNFWLQDLDSTNGTFIGAERIEGRALIGPGTAFQVGRTQLELISN